MVASLNQIVDSGISQILLPRRDDEDLQSSAFDLMIQVRDVLDRRGAALPHPSL